MSDGLHRVAGVAPPIELCGKVYQTTPWTLGGRAEIESHLLAKRPDLLADVAKRLDTLPAKMQEKVLDSAMRVMSRGNFVTDNEVREYIASLEGAAHLFWQAVREHHPEVNTLDEAIAIVRQCEIGELHNKLARVMGRFDLGGSNGPEQAAALDQTTNHAAPRGPVSIEDLPSSMAGSLSESTA